jgi:pseudouridine kinase
VRLTQREQEIIDLLRVDPTLDAAALAERLGATRAAVAVHLSNLTRKGAILGRGYLVRRERAVVVVGGANMDIKVRSAGAVVLNTSNPGSAATTPGGVARNIAENLARLGTPTHLVAPIGRDDFGEQLLARTRAAGVAVDHMVTTRRPTGTYVAILDAVGELVAGVSDMAATDQLAVSELMGARDLINHAELLVLDGNLPPACAAWLLDFAAASEVPVVLDPVSVVKAEHAWDALSPARPVLAITPSHDELSAIAGRRVGTTADAVARAARRLHDRGVTHVWVRRGADGGVLSSRVGPGPDSVTVLAAPATTVVDVTGAGDAATAGFVHALLRGDSPVQAARFGHLAAALTVASPDTVRPDLSRRLVLASRRAEQSA